LTVDIIVDHFEIEVLFRNDARISGGCQQHKQISENGVENVEESCPNTYDLIDLLK